MTRKEALKAIVQSWQTPDLMTHAGAASDLASAGRLCAGLEALRVIEFAPEPIARHCIRVTTPLASYDAMVDETELVKALRDAGYRVTKG